MDRKKLIKAIILFENLYLERDYDIGLEKIMMNVSIIYESMTGNTEAVARAIAEAIREGSKEYNIIFFGSASCALENKNNNDIDIDFLGSWTDKGDCGGIIKQYSKTLNGQNVAIFGTAGFGGSKEYYITLENKFSEAVPDSNTILGGFYCQGKMQMSIRDRYCAMLEKNPEDKRLITSIENFDSADKHPDASDLMNAKMFAMAMMDKL